MKKVFIYYVMGLVLLVAGVFYSCQKDDSNGTDNVIVQKKGKPHSSASVTSWSVYFSPDSATPYSCYVPCPTVPNPTGIDPISNSGSVIQVTLAGLGYTTGYTDNYADSIQYVVSDGTNGVCWTEKWCNTNGAFMPIATLQSLFTQAGVTGTTLTVTVIPYGANGSAGTTYTSSPFSL